MIADYVELNKRFDYGEMFYLASELLSKRSEQDILRNLSLLYQSQVYEDIVEQDLGIFSPEEIVEMYKKELRM